MLLIGWLLEVENLRASIKVGYVDSLVLNRDTYYAAVKFSIDEAVEIPVDSRAIIASSGLLGGKYIRINPGASDDNFTDGSYKIHSGIFEYRRFDCQINVLYH